MDNMVHRESSSKLSSLRNGIASSEEKLAPTALRNRSYTVAPMERRNSKRLKVAAVSDSPPKYGSVSVRLRPRANQKEVQIETYENMNVSRENMGERHLLKSVVDKLRSDMDVGVTEGDESHRDNMQELKKDMNLPENTSEQNMIDAAEVQPLSYCFPKEDGKFSVVRDFPPWMVSNFSKSEKTVKVAISKENQNLVLEKSDPRDHLGQSLTKNISPKVLEPLKLEKSKVTFQKPIETPNRRITRKGVVVPSSLKLSKKTNGEYGEGSRSKNGEKDIRDKEGLAQKHRLSNTGDRARFKVKKTLRLFSGACRELLREEEARPRKKNGSIFRVDFEASKFLRSRGQCLKTDTPIIGHVPGVKVGDEFQFRMELNILGIHRPSQGGIDYIKDENEKLIATSIVSSGCYGDEVDDSDVVIYTGQGGNVMSGQKKGDQNLEPKDQQLVRGNLALVNTKAKKNPVRVIRGNKKTRSSSDAKNYVYDGLYLVEKFWKETGSHGKRVYKFKLRRIPGQPEVSWKVPKDSKKSMSRDAHYNVDLSGGKERFPIYVVNDLDNEKPHPFIYTVEMIYPDWCRPIPPRGCGCKTLCSESKNCACVAKNRGELPYNNDGAFVIAKQPLVYECGPLCNCPPSCYLRVTQLGIKFQLEIFKTESRGWGVRSLDAIPSGSFICEYAGELLEDNEAERLTGEDEYLFDIDKEDENSGFVIDAARKGNIGRFINHSCSPNLYAQEVLYDHDEKRIPHIMFFAIDDIPPLEELSYDYNYKIDEVRDSNGNIKKKICYCGSSDCTGRLY